MSNDSNLIKPPDKLSGKVSVGGPGAVDANALARAEQVIADLSGNYLDWAKEDIARLQEAFSKLKNNDGDMAENLEGIFQISHDVKGQGGSFDYQLMTIIGNQLCRFIENLDGSAEPTDVEVIELHINALYVVIGNQLSGDGGAVGEKLLSGLEAVFAKRAGG